MDKYRTTYKEHLEHLRIMLDSQFPAQHAKEIRECEKAIQAVEQISDEEYLRFLQAQAKQMFKAEEVMMAIRLHKNTQTVTFSDGFKHKVSFTMPTMQDVGLIGDKIGQTTVTQSTLPREIVVSRVNNYEEELCTDRLSDYWKGQLKPWASYINPETEQQ